MNADTELKATMLFVWMTFMLLMFRRLPKSFSSRRWPQVSGRIIANETSSRPGAYGMTMYVPVVSYRYNVKGQEYQSNSLTFLGTSGGFGGTGFKWQMARLLDALIPDTPVNVFVNPKDPTDAVLFPGVHWSQYAALIAITISCLGVAFIVQILNLIWPGCQPNCT